MLKLLFNILIVYSLWQLIKMFFAVKNTQQNFQNQMNEMNRQMNNQQPKENPKTNHSKVKDEGEYIDFEEIK